MKRSIVTILIMLVPAIFFGYYGKTAEMGLIIVTSSITCAFLNIDKIQKFKGAGFEAEMKKAVDEAYVTIESLKELSKPLIKATMYSINYSNRWGGININERHLMKNQMEDIAIRYGLKNAEIEIVFDQFRHLHTWDMFQRFSNSVCTTVNTTAVRERFASIGIYKHKDYPSKQEVENMIADLEITLSDEHSRLLDDYIYYLSEGKLRSEICEEE